MADEDRPQYQSGVGTINGTQFHWGSGTPGKYWSIPYGDYPVTPNAPTGAWAHQVGAIPIANNVIPDPQLGRNRIGIMIHSGSAPSLDQLYTEGCFKVDPQDWPNVRSQILNEASKGPLYLHVAPGGVAAFTNTKTFSQAGNATPAANANAAANTTAAANPNAPAQGGSVGLVANELIKRGVSPQVAAGAVAGLMGESGANLDPTSFNSKDPGGGSGGIGQWNQERLIGQNGMLAFAKNAGVPNIDVNTPTDAKKVPLAIQAQYLGHELDTSYSGVLKGLQSVKTGEEGLTTWVNNYENPADKAGAIAQRTQYIQPVTAQLTGAGGTAVASATPGTTINTTGALPGFADAKTSNQFLQNLDQFDKSLGGRGLGLQGQGQGEGQGQPDMPRPPVIPPPDLRNASSAQSIGRAASQMLPSLTHYEPQAYGQTLNSDPLAIGAGTPQQPDWLKNAGLQQAAQPSPYGTSIGSMQMAYGLSPQQLQMMMNPMMLAQSGGFS